MGPLWLGHRFEQALFEQRLGNGENALKIANQILQLDLRSPTSRLALDWFGDLTSSGAVAVQDQVPPLSPSPVQTYQSHLIQAIKASRGNDLSQGISFLKLALGAVHGQAPFVLDAFDWIMDAKAQSLARDLVTSDAWPRHSEIANNAAARLSEPSRGSNAAEKQPEQNADAVEKERKGTGKSPKGTGKKKLRKKGREAK